MAGKEQEDEDRALLSSHLVLREISTFGQVEEIEDITFAGFHLEDQVVSSLYSQVSCDEVNWGQETVYLQ
jgi:hypothetical protein